MVSSPLLVAPERSPASREKRPHEAAPHFTVAPIHSRVENILRPPVPPKTSVAPNKSRFYPHTFHISTAIFLKKHRSRCRGRELPLSSGGERGGNRRWFAGEEAENAIREASGNGDAGGGHADGPFPDVLSPCPLRRVSGAEGGFDPPSDRSHRSGCCVLAGCARLPRLDGPGTFVAQPAVWSPVTGLSTCSLPHAKRPVDMRQRVQLPVLLVLPPRARTKNTKQFFCGQP